MFRWIPTLYDTAVVTATSSQTTAFVSQKCFAQVPASGNARSSGIRGSYVLVFFFLFPGNALRKQHFFCRPAALTSHCPPPSPRTCFFVTHRSSDGSQTDRRVSSPTDLRSDFAVRRRRKREAKNKTDSKRRRSVGSGAGSDAACFHFIFWLEQESSRTPACSDVFV